MKSLIPIAPIKGKNLLTDQQQKDHFDKIVNNPKSWWRKCRSLHSAAKDLFRIYKRDIKKIEEDGSGIIQDAPISAGYYDQVLLLYWFAIECLLKGLYVADGGKISKDGKFIEGISKAKHNLITLCEINKDIILNDEEKRVFLLLSKVIVGYGRYPTMNGYCKDPIKYTKERGFSSSYISSWGDLTLLDNFIVGIIGDNHIRI